MTVGSRIREFRKRLGLSVDDVAEKLVKNRATIYRYESDDIENLPAPILEPLAKVLQTTPAELMGWQEEKRNAPASGDLPDLTPKDEREIMHLMDDMKENLMQEEGLMFDGQPASPESIQSILDAMQIGMEMAKKRNKAKYTPKKYRHED